MVVSLAQKMQNRSPKIIHLCLLAGIFALLSGCSAIQDWFEKNGDRTCPKVAMIASAGKLEAADAQLEISNLGYECKYGKKEVDYDIEITFTAKQNKSSAPVTAHYFVAYVAPDDTILQKQIFPVTIQFKNKEQIAIATEAVHLSLPLENKTENLGGYQILIGFQNNAENAAP